MTYGRKNLKLEFHQGIAIPYYLDKKRDEELIGDVIEFYESNIGKPYGSIDWEYLRIIIGDDRLYNALRKVMRIFYRPRDVKLKPIVNPKSLRLRIFQLVNEKYEGFIPSDLRDKALEEIRRELRIGYDIDEVLWCDDVNELPLTRVREVTVDEVVKAFNFETIDTVCVNSSKIIIECSRSEKLLGVLAKSIGRYCKLYGLVYDMRYVNELFRATIEGPRSLFGKPTRYGTRLSLLLTKTLPILYSMKNWNVKAIMYTQRKRINVQVLSDNLKPELGIVSELTVKEIFDSRIEEIIYRILKTTKLHITREEEPIALGDLIYIPDFKVRTSKGVFYIEIAGYWRKEYAEKKAYKLHEISKIMKNMILIADEKLKPYFNKLKIPVIYYRMVGGKPILPYSKIIKTIKEQ